MFVVTFTVMPEKPRGYKIWEPLLLSIAVVIGMLVGAQLAGSGFAGGIGKQSASGIDASRITEIIRFIEEKYVDEVDSPAMIEKAITGILDELDPHSGYISPEEIAEINERMEGHFNGIGIRFHVLLDSIVVLFVSEDGPAAKAGVQMHDRIVYANGESMVGLEIGVNDYVDMLRGPKNSEIDIQVKRRGVDTLIPFTLVRDKIPIRSIAAAYMLDDATGYVKINNFSASTYKDFMIEIEHLVDSEGMRHLVLDLRENPGGYLKEAVNILSQFFQEKGKLLVYTEGENVKRMEYKSTGKPFHPIENIAILIDGGSASASEIIAGAIQDHDRGVIIGEKSYGKGLVQEQYHLKDGGALRLTIARYYTPSGRSIQKPYLNGYLHPDSSRVASDTSMIYETSAGRTVYADGGITPDIRVPAKFDWQKSTAFLNYSRILEFMFYGFQDPFYDSLRSKEDYLSLLPDSDAMFDQVTRYFEIDPSGEDYDAASADWELAYTMIRAMACSYHFGEDAWFEVFNAEDPVVLKAAEVVAEDTRTTLKLDLE